MLRTPDMVSVFVAVSMVLVVPAPERERALVIDMPLAAAFRVVASAMERVPVPRAPLCATPSVPALNVVPPV